MAIIFRKILALKENIHILEKITHILFQNEVVIKWILQIVEENINDLLQIIFAQLEFSTDGEEGI